MENEIYSKELLEKLIKWKNHKIKVEKYMRPLYWGIILALFGFFMSIFIQSFWSLGIEFYYALEIPYYISEFIMLFSIPISLIIEFYEGYKGKKKKEE